LTPPEPQRWQIAPPAPPSHLAALSNYHPVIAQIFYHRGITDWEAAEKFLAREETETPFRLRGMSEAVARIRQALKRGERITVYGDYDTDGVTATALAVETLEALGAQVTPFIPTRGDAGYGLNRRALKRIACDGSTLVVTVDCGVRAFDELHYARGLGLDVIVTDHHTPGHTLPPVRAVINPKRVDCRYPFQDFSGVGLAFKLAQALLRAEKQVPLNKIRRDLREADLLDLVALGTVADLVPLVGENRSLVARGLQRLARTERPGLVHLMKLARVPPEQVDSVAIGFRLGPRINAAGRMSDPMIGFRLLVTSSENEAARTATELNELNRRRQELTTEMFDLALSQVDDPTENILIVADPRIPEGIMGLVASKLAERFYRPAVVIARSDEISRGSARSIAEFDITAALDQCSHRFVKHGGHAMAAGFTIKNHEIEPFRKEMAALAAQSLSDKELQPTLVVDAEIPLEEATRELRDALHQLEPFGYGNQAPVLVSRGVYVKGRHRVGGDGKHLRLYLSPPSRDSAWEAIAFGMGDWYDHLPAVIDVAYHLEVNHWNNREKLQLNVQDLRPAA
jgi:single-stranded-DNA-specific exonuclease